MNLFLSIIALLPALWLARGIYRKDGVEKEPVGLLIRCFLLGMLMALPAILLELAGDAVLSTLIPGEIGIVHIILYFFLVVGPSEEGVKHFAMKRLTWNSPYFDWRFDGVVYGVTTALGFAAIENIMYVTGYGLGNALVRAVTAVPGHAIFGMYMGHYYGMSKYWMARGNTLEADRARRRSIIIPVLLHGMYDVLAVYNFFPAFLLFMIGLYIMANHRLQSYEAQDKPFSVMQEWMQEGEEAADEQE